MVNDLTVPDDKISDWTKLKAFAHDKIDFAKIVISVSDRVEPLFLIGFLFLTLFLFLIR